VNTAKVSRNASSGVICSMCHRQHRHESSARQGIEAVNMDARRLASRPGALPIMTRLAPVTKTMKKGATTLALPPRKTSLQASRAGNPAPSRGFGE
jgi:hypothetical protein